MRPKTLRTRTKRRLTEKEQAIIGTLYLGVCRAFEKDLFAEQEAITITDPDNVTAAGIPLTVPTYADLFEHYNRKWKRACKLVEPKLKLLSADPDIFAREYKSTVAA